VLFVFFLPVLILIFSVLAKKFARKSVFDMIYLVSCGTLNLNSVNHYHNNILVSVST